MACKRYYENPNIATECKSMAKKLKCKKLTCSTTLIALLIKKIACNCAFLCRGTAVLNNKIISINFHIAFNVEVIYMLVVN